MPKRDEALSHAALYCVALLAVLGMKSCVEPLPDKLTCCRIDVLPVGAASVSIYLLPARWAGRNGMQLPKVVAFFLLLSLHRLCLPSHGCHL